MTAKKRLPIRMWRVSRAEPFGLHLWFDPEVEFPRLFTLEPEQKARVLAFNEEDDYESDPDDCNQDQLLLLEEELPF